jgi:uncharacterized RDD family membrane protein YckC
VSAEEIAPDIELKSHSAGVFRRFGAALYDGLLLIGLMMVVTAVLLPLTGGEAITAADYGAWEYAYRALLIALFVGFHGLFWTRRGQTLGMAAWRLRLQRENGDSITWGDTLKRLAAACVSWAPLALGYFWILVDRDRLAWHDRWTGTRVVVLPKKK